MLDWSYRNSTTGSEMECNDLNFLLHELRNVKGLQIPQDAGNRLMETGTTSLTVLDDTGVENKITLECRPVMFKSVFEERKISFA
jgi:hypothetical protein